MFITFEGIEGGGKTTQMRRLAEVLTREGLDVIVTREPGGTPEAERIRQVLIDPNGNPFDGLTQTLLLFAGRRENVINNIRPALARGAIVLCDRFADSTRVMQGGPLGAKPEDIETLYRMTVGDLVPDLTLILDADPTTCLARARARPGGGDRYERMPLSFHENLRHGFLALAASEPNRFVVIDANRAEDAVHQDIVGTVQKRRQARHV